MTHEELAALEADSIRSFVGFAGANGYLKGRVLDFGCGKQPYRDIVEKAGGEYTGYDRSFFPGNASGREIGVTAFQGTLRWDTILCTQVVQYIDHWYLNEQLREFSIKAEHLVLTYPTTWPEIRDDLCRFTKLGMEHLLTDAGFTIIEHSRRAVIPHEGFELALGYGCIARA